MFVQEFVSQHSPIASVSFTHVNIYPLHLSTLLMSTFTDYICTLYTSQHLPITSVHFTHVNIHRLHLYALLMSTSTHYICTFYSRQHSPITSVRFTHVNIDPLHLYALFMSTFTHYICTLYSRQHSPITSARFIHVNIYPLHLYALLTSTFTHYICTLHSRQHRRGGWRLLHQIICKTIAGRRFLKVFRILFYLFSPLRLDQLLLIIIMISAQQYMQYLIFWDSSAIKKFIWKSVIKSACVLITLSDDVLLNETIRRKKFFLKIIFCNELM